MLLVILSLIDDPGHEIEIFKVYRNTEQDEKPEQILNDHGRQFYTSHSQISISSAGNMESNR